MLAAICMTYPGATQAAAPSGCADFTVVGVRGAGATPGSPGIGGEISALMAPMPPGTNALDTLALPYPAPDGSAAWLEEIVAGLPIGATDLLNLLWQGVGRGQSLLAFTNAIEAGASAMFSGASSLSDLVKACPDTRIVLVGHSEGALVVDYGLALAARTGKADWVFQHISAVLLYGDPFHVPDSPELQYNVGAVSAYGLLTKWEPDLLNILDTDNGFPPGYVPTVPASLRSKTQSYCFANDPLCDTSACCLAHDGNFDFCRLLACPNVLKTLDTPHDHYPDLSFNSDTYVIDGARFAFSKMTADVAFDLRTTGECIVAGSGRLGSNLVGLTAPVTPISTTPPLPATVQAFLPAIYNANNGAPLAQGETANYEIDFERPVTNLVIGVKVNGFTVATEYYQGPAATRVSSNGDPYVVPALPPGVYGRIPYEVDVSGDAQCLASGTIWIPSPAGAKAVTVTAAVAAALFLILLAAFV